MEEPAEPTPGPNKSESRRAVEQVLSDQSLPAYTVGDVADRVDFSRRTVHTRLKEIEEKEEYVCSGKIGGAKAYWVEETEPTTPAGIDRMPQAKQLGMIPVLLFGLAYLLVFVPLILIIVSAPYAVGAIIGGLAFMIGVFHTFRRYGGIEA